MFELILKGNPAYSWTKEDSFCFIGFIYAEDGQTLREAEAAGFLNDLLTHNENPEEATSGINGIYSFIRIYEDRVIISTDIVNFLPLFYLRSGLKWVISDDWNELVRYKNGLNPDFDAVPGFLSAGFVCGNKTLDCDILKTRAGSILTIYDNGTTGSETDFNFLPVNFTGHSYNDLVDEAEDCFLEAGKRMISFLNGRTAVLPLSGGFDSRLIACTLKRLGYDNVICFTYGKKTAEVGMSRQVAETLGYKWHYVNYSEIEFKGYTKDADFREYVLKYSEGYSMFYLQEYFAMKELLKNNLIPDDSVFLPGHSGDYLGGSYVEKTAATGISNHNLAGHLLEKYFIFKKPVGKSKEILRQQISGTLKDYPAENNFSEKYNPYIEDWDIKEKLSKFIFRSSYVFTHFGFEHIYPLWDRELIKFFRSLPFKLRSGKQFYNQVAIEKFFKPLNVYFSTNEVIYSRFFIFFQKIKDKTRNMFPWSLVLQRMIKNDWLNYYGFTREMESDLQRRNYKPLKKYKMFTVIICRWYLDFIGFPNK